MRLTRADLQAVFGNNPRVIARFEQLDQLVDALEQKASDLGVSLEAAQAQESSVQPLSSWLTALSGLPYNKAGAIELRGGNVVSVRAIDTDDDASLATRALVTSHFGGSVKSVSVVAANGVSGTVATETTTPAITLTLGAITPTSVAATGNVTGLNLSGTNTGDQTSVTGNAGTATALQTARLINGVSFNGSADITINAVDSTARVPTTRLVNTTAPLTGGGDLLADRTLAISAATTLAAGSMSAADKTKLDGVATGATANATDAQLRDRATHTGTQAASTLTGTVALPVANAGAITSSSPSAGIGYATGAGGSITQITSKTTSVTLNTMSGQITTHNAALAAGAVATFAVNNSGVDGNDTISLNIAQGGATGQNYRFWVAGVDAGVFYITLENRSAGSLSEAVRFNFAVIKGVNA